MPIGRAAPAAEQEAGLAPPSVTLAPVKPVVIERLLERLWHGDPHARDELRSLGPEAADAVPALADAVGRSDNRRSDKRSRDKRGGDKRGNKRLACDALFVLEGIGPAARAALPAVFSALEHTDGDVSAMAADTLAAMGEAAVEGLVAVLEGDDGHRCQAACRALGILGTAARPAVPALLAHVHDAREEVAMRAIWALGCIRDPAALEPLAGIVTEHGGMLGCWAAEALAEYGTAARSAASALRDELHRDDPDLILACASALVAIRMHEDAAVWALISLLQTSKDADLGTEAAITLGECGSVAGAAIPALRAAAFGDSSADRRASDGAPGGDTRGGDTRSGGDAELRTQAKFAIAKIRPEFARDIAV